MTSIPQAMESPVSLREFVVSPGFAGAAAVVAALIVLCAVLIASRRTGKRVAREFELREKHQQEAREAEQHAAASQRGWETLKWLVETAGIEPAASEGATLGLGPELAMATLRGLLRDAERLGDETLADAVTVYQSQFALVLAQQGGPLAELATAASSPASAPSPTSGPAATGARSPQPQPSPSTPEPETPRAGAEQAAPPKDVSDKQPAGDESGSAITELATGGRRRKQ